MTQPIKATALDKLNMEILSRMGGHAGLLRGWKEIAAFLRVHKMTAMRYFKFRGLPVSYLNKRAITTPFLISMWVVHLGDTRIKELHDVAVGCYFKAVTTSLI
jgi:hypothetical protein